MYSLFFSYETEYSTCILLYHILDIFFISKHTQNIVLKQVGRNIGFIKLRTEVISRCSIWLKEVIL